jgi:Na+-transporting methylmalonyl-CoA/oxaloacetate decarboxylase gamma subunit
MRTFVFLSIIILFSSAGLLVGQVIQEKVSPEKAATEKTQADTRNSSSLSAEEAAALREDIARMRAILGQMETNLAFVDTTQSPLKHQFQLEIDMWNTVITDMERRLKPGTK